MFYFGSSNQFGIHSSIYSMNYSSKFIFLQRTVQLLESIKATFIFLLNLYLHINLFLDFLICSVSLFLQALHNFNYKAFAFYTFFSRVFLAIPPACLFFLVNFKINFYYRPPEKNLLDFYENSSKYINKRQSWPVYDGDSSKTKRLCSSPFVFCKSKLFLTQALHI